jgi:hypothetical protein
MNCVAVTRQALGLRQGAASLHFALGWPEWRMFTAIVICGLILVVAIGVYVIVGTALLAAVQSTPMALVAAVYSVAGLFAVAWLMLRLGFLLPAIVVVEERVDLVRAWMLSRRNFWRIFAVFLAVTLPVLLVQAVAVAAIVGPGLFAPLPENSTSATAALQDRMAMLDRHMAEMIGLTLVLAPFSLGLTLGASSWSYRALAPAKPDRAAPQ